MVDTRSFLYRPMDQLQAKQTSDGQHMTNLFRKLQRHVSALQTAAATSINKQLDNERLRNVSYVKQIIYYKLMDLLKRSLSKRVGVCDTEFSSALRRNLLETSMPCALQSLLHISQHISRTVAHNNTLFLPLLPYVAQPRASSFLQAPTEDCKLQQISFHCDRSLSNEGNSPL